MKDILTKDNFFEKDLEEIESVFLKDKLVTDLPIKTDERVSLRDYIPKFLNIKEIIED